MKTFLDLKEIPYQLVRPQKWQKQLFQGMIVKDTKIASAEWCKRKYPKYDFRRTQRCKIPHDGKTDSCCIANYALKNW